MLVLLKAVAAFILPPGGNLVAIVLGLCVLRRRRRAGIILLTLGVGSLYLFSLGPVATELSHSLEQRYAPVVPASLVERGAQAIVVMGGGRYPAAPEYGGIDTVSQAALVRLRFAARVAAATGLPVAVTGGRVYGESRSEAEVMAATLEDDFRTPVRWREERARNSAENATFTRALLPPEVRRIILVTHANHMHRSVKMFELQGFEVVPAPTAFVTRGDGDYDYRVGVPSIGNLYLSVRALHEYLGIAWYSIRYRGGS